VALTAAVVLTAAVTKFTAGAWIVVLLIPLLVLFCVQRHYAHAREALPRIRAESSSPPARHRQHRREWRRPPSVSKYRLRPAISWSCRSRCWIWLGCAALAYAASLRVPVLAHCSLRMPSGG